MKNYVEMAESIMKNLDGDLGKHVVLCIEEDMLHILIGDKPVVSLSVIPEKEHEVKYNKEIISEKDVVEIIMILNSMFNTRNYINHKKSTLIPIEKILKAPSLKTPVKTPNYLMDALEAGKKSHSNVFKALAQKEADERKEAAETPKSKLRTGDTVKVKTGDNFFVLKGTRHGDILTHVSNNFTISLKDYDEELNNIKDARYGIESVGAVKEDYNYLSISSINYLTVIQRGEDPRIAELQKKIEELKQQQGWC